MAKQEQGKVGLHIEAGHQADGKDGGAAANGYVESKLAKELRDKIVDEILKRPNGAGIPIMTDDDKDTLREVIQAYNKIGDEDTITLSIHFNAATPKATGTEVFVPKRHTTQEWDLADRVVKATREVLGIRSRGVKDPSASQHADLYISKIYGVNILWEVCFITNTDDMDSYVKRVDKLAKKIADILVDEATK